MLQKIGFLPGFNKQITETTAEGQWVDGDNVRFRYGLPEKIGGWQQLTTSTFAGQAREQHMWTDLNGRQYAAIGTDKLLLVYYSNAFYDITPLASTISGGTFTSVNGSATVTINVLSPDPLARAIWVFPGESPSDEPLTEGQTYKLQWAYQSGAQFPSPMLSLEQDMNYPNHGQDWKVVIPPFDVNSEGVTTEYDWTVPADIGFEEYYFFPKSYQLFLQNLFLKKAHLQL